MMEGPGTVQILMTDPDPGGPKTYGTDPMGPDPQHGREQLGNGILCTGRYQYPHFEIWQT